jgi:DNA replication protein DnaC
MNEEEIIRPPGMSDEDWAIVEPAERSRRQKAAQNPLPATKIQEPLEKVIARVNNLPPIHVAGIVEDPKKTKRRELISKADIPKRHWKAWTDHGGKFDTQAQWLEKSLKLESKMGTGAIIGIIGDRGRGKTQMAVNAIIAVCSKQEEAMFCTAMDFFMEVKKSYRPTSKVSEDAVIERYLRPSLLVVDEIHERSDSDWENRLIFHTINKRYEELKDTIMIGAYHDEKEPLNAVKAFKEAVGKSIVSRLREGGGVINCIWPSFRGD